MLFLFSNPRSAASCYRYLGTSLELNMSVLFLLGDRHPTFYPRFFSISHPPTGTSRPPIVTYHQVPRTSRFGKISSSILDACAARAEVATLSLYIFFLRWPALLPFSPLLLFLSTTIDSWSIGIRGHIRCMNWLITRDPQTQKYYV